MNALTIRCWGLLTSAVVLVGLGCDAPETSSPSKEPTPAKKSALGKNVWFEVQGGQRRVLINASICLREGQLEELLCRTNTKEHEAILAADVDARMIHAALEAAGAKAGAPVKFDPKFVPPTGTRVKITLQYEKDGKLVTVPAQHWIRDVKTRKDLDQDWVFAGSQLVPNPDDPKKPPFYRANEGDVICVINRDNALLDLPIYSPKALDDRIFEAHTERIPPLNTKVVVILEPMAEKK